MFCMISPTSRVRTFQTWRSRFWILSSREASDSTSPRREDIHSRMGLRVVMTDAEITPTVQTNQTTRNNKQPTMDVNVLPQRSATRRSLKQPRWLLEPKHGIYKVSPNCATSKEQKNNQIDFFDIAALCIDKVEYGGEIISDATLEEKEEFIDNLTKDEFAKINLFFATIPVVENEVIFNCEKCEATNINTMNGYMSFSE